MALAFANFKRFAPMKGGIRMGTVDITLDGSYSAGGWAISASDLNLTSIVAIIPPGPGVASNLGYPLRWDHATGKLLAFEEADGGAGLQEIDAGDLNNEVIRCMYVGT